MFRTLRLFADLLLLQLFLNFSCLSRIINLAFAHFGPPNAKIEPFFLESVSESTQFCLLYLLVSWKVRLGKVMKSFKGAKKRFETILRLVGKHSRLKF